MSELRTPKCFIETGLENDPLMADKHAAFVGQVASAAEVCIVSAAPYGEYDDAIAEVAAQRRRLVDFRETGDMLALWVTGQTPRTKSAVMAGFAAGLRRPIAVLRSDSGRTGEDGVPFNLMLPAAIEFSRGDQIPSWREPLRIAQDMNGLTREVAEAAREAGRFKTFPPTHGSGLPKPVAYLISPYGFAESTSGYCGDDGGTIEDVVNRFAGTINPWKVVKPDVAKALRASPQERARAWTAAGVNHIKRILFEADFVVAGLDQEPMDAGSLVEIGVAAACDKPIVLYRSDLRVCSEGPARLDATVQAAATLNLSSKLALSRVDQFARSIEELEAQVQAVAEALTT